MFWRVRLSTARGYRAPMENYCQNRLYLDKAFVVYYNKLQGFMKDRQINIFTVFMMLSNVDFVREERR